ncbi:hypothetical protein Q5P01_009966 [Channa striata]|uniref:Ig-like domain-containing protein n=1 Tax=Channa striata TaxID=64152 RepID=A0AA88MYX1_CHASR|nr:hypothetical protein Q5P01_009966 [Channa striata]
MLRGVICSSTTLRFTLYEVTKMNADRWIFPLALCFIYVSSNDENICGGLCKTKTLMAPLGSSVLLPCNFTNIGLSWVSWAHNPKVDLVLLSSEGRIKFLDPKSGRVKAFPNQGSKGNYSIGIDELEESDLGCYRCIQDNACLQVHLSASSETLTRGLWLLIYISVGVTAFILLSVCSYFLVVPKNRILGNLNNSASDASVVVDHNAGVTASPSAPPQEIIRPPVQEQQGRAYNNDLVYENDDQRPPIHWISNTPGAMSNVASTQPTQNPSELYPNLNQFNFQRVESERTKHRFHRELMNRLRKASSRRHYYVNQHELSKQQAMSSKSEDHQRGIQIFVFVLFRFVLGFFACPGKKKVKENLEYQNPIYNRSTDQLNKL